MTQLKPDSEKRSFKRSRSLTLDDRLRIERKLVATIRDKLDAISNAQLKIIKDNPPGPDESKPSRTSRKSVERLKTEVALLLKSTGLRPFVPTPGIPDATKEEKLICRLDFDAYFFIPTTSIDDAERQTTPIYAQTVTDYNERINSCRSFPRSPGYRPEHYDLFSSYAWQEFANYPNFLNSASRLRQQLAQIQLPPNRIQDLNHYDFIHLMVAEMRRTRKPLYEPMRSRHLKLFAECYGEQYRSIMSIRQYTPEYIENSLFKMSRGRINDENNMHHDLNVHCLNHMEKKSDMNALPNVSVVPKEPYHRSFHYPLQLRIPPNTIFYGGYDPLFQIRRNLEREKEYARRHFDPNMQLNQALKNAYNRSY